MGLFQHVHGRVRQVRMVRALEENRALAVEDIRAAKDLRGGLLAMQKHEKAVRASFANLLAAFAVAEDPFLVAAE